MSSVVNVTRKKHRETQRNAERECVCVAVQPHDHAVRILGGKVPGFFQSRNVVRSSVANRSLYLSSEN